MHYEPNVFWPLLSGPLISWEQFGPLLSSLEAQMKDFRLSLSLAIRTSKADFINANPGIAVTLSHSIRYF